jgi:hypothetical protein
VGLLKIKLSIEYVLDLLVILTSGHIKTFGFGEIEIAFGEAVKHDKEKARVCGDSS